MRKWGRGRRHVARIQEQHVPSIGRRCERERSGSGERRRIRYTTHRGSHPAHTNEYSPDVPTMYPSLLFCRIPFP